jgi:hypothetical protein
MVSRYAPLPSVSGSAHFKRETTQFQTGSVSGEYDGQMYKFEFEYRDPWEWIRSIVTDPTLCKSVYWYPVRKYLHDNGHITRLIDQPNTANKWWRVQVCSISTLLIE